MVYLSCSSFFFVSELETAPRYCSKRYWYNVLEELEPPEAIPNGAIYIYIYSMKLFQTNDKKKQIALAMVRRRSIITRYQLLKGSLTNQKRF